jgi:serine/threonine protein kinase
MYFYNFRALVSLHERSFVHADLKPANIMWSSYDGRFKLLDFGLTFHIGECVQVDFFHSYVLKLFFKADEDDLHQIQSPGYKSPEAAEWNKYKDDMKKKRKRKLQGTYADLTKAAPAYDGGLHTVGVNNKTPLVISSPADSPLPHGAASRTILRPPPRRHRLSGVASGSSDRESILVLDEYQRHSRRGSNSSMTSTASAAMASTVAAAAASVTAACNKWLSESSGIFTASTQSQAASSGNSVQVSTPEAASTTTSTMLSSITSSMDAAAEDPEDSQEWRRGRARSRSKPKQPRPTSVCAALADKERPTVPNAAVDM